MQSRLPRTETASRFGGVARFLGSIRLAVVLLVLIAVAAAIGGVVPQAPTTPGAETLYHSYGAFWYRVITRLAFDDVFHSPWFLALIAALALNLSLCTIRRLAASVRGLMRGASPAAGRRHEGAGIRLAIPGQGAEDVRSAIAAVLELRRFRVIRRDDALVGERRRLTRLAADVIHLGVLVVLAGALLGILRFEGMLVVHERQRGEIIAPCAFGAAALGQSSSPCLERGTFSLRVDDFGVEVHPDGLTPKSYWSDVTILEDTREVRTARISVNRPLTHRGISFYQMTYGYDSGAARVRLAVRDRTGDASVAEVDLGVGETAPIPGSSVWITLARVFASLGVGEGGEPFDRPTTTAENPAALFQLVGTDALGEEVAYHDLVFGRFPDTHLNPDVSYPIRLLEVEIPTRVGIRYVISPGYPVAWAGFAVLSLGLVGSFYLRPVWIDVRVTEDDTGRWLDVRADDGARSKRDVLGIAQQILAALGDREVSSDG